MAEDERSAARLARDAELAARIRTLKTDPDVVALHVERVRKQVEWLTWISIGLGLLFTLVNVQQFAAGSAAPWSFRWTTAWLLDPMVSLALIAVLRAEMVTARYQLFLNGWGQATKWFTLSATFVMNTWSSWSSGSPAQIVLHTVPVATVFVVANAAPGLRDRLTEAVVRAAEEAERLASRDSRPAVSEDPVPVATASTEPLIPVAVPVIPIPAPSRPEPTQKPRSKPGHPSDEELVTTVRRMATELGRTPGINKIRKECKVGEDRARDALAVLSMNGHGPGTAVS